MMGTELSRGEHAGLVLAVDDDPEMVRLMERAFRSAGLEVATATNGSEAMSVFEQGGVQVVVSDIAMPGVNGLELLRRLHEQDAALPVILITGEPNLSSAMRAIEHAAFRYIPKPLDHEDLVRTVQQAVEVRRQRSACNFPVANARVSPADIAAFDRALAEAYMVFQPIVDWSQREVFGFEALFRTREPTFRSPLEVLDLAERIGRISDVGRVARRASAAALRQAPASARLFVNLHAADLDDPDLYDPAAPLSRVASRVVLEITERSRLEHVAGLRERVRSLRELGFQIAIDDLGVGYSGLSSFALLEPDVVKMDMSLVRDIQTAFTKRKLVGSLLQVCADLDLLVVAEGVESPAERDTLSVLGCPLFQGYLFGRPSVEFTSAALT
jgi:EAL domain-containing protein (putative c-di-GMP-specific phosphodiesterase class I)